MTDNKTETIKPLGLVIHCPVADTIPNELGGFLTDLNEEYASLEYSYLASGGNHLTDKIAKERLDPKWDKASTPEDKRIEVVVFVPDEIATRILIRRISVELKKHSQKRSVESYYVYAETSSHT